MLPCSYNILFLLCLGIPELVSGFDVHDNESPSDKYKEEPKQQSNEKTAIIFQLHDKHKEHLIVEPKETPFTKDDKWVFNLSNDEVVEVIFGDAVKNSNQFFRVRTADGILFKATSVDTVFNFFLLYKSKVTHVNFFHVMINTDLIRMMKLADKLLWTGIVHIEDCNFDLLREEEILDFFQNVIRPEALSLQNNDYLPNEVLNTAIKDHLLDSNLAFLGEDSLNVTLNAYYLLDYLHRPGANLTINPEFINGGLSLFVEEMIERFVSDTEPVPFTFQLTNDIELLLVGEPLENPVTQELLEQSTIEEASVKRTVLRRYRRESSE
ncbi:hypothetical protein DdX_10070 [Ditylenchus destructor]|uniref:Uncharacterized protein n=1 Tax=Ditylenchus destructor TaxID=166010 RepID=A0AAD4N1P2_9BILA|nr:hypothetical protein DdX_10070 [Ditylenchus destructor]